MYVEIVLAQRRAREGGQAVRPRRRASSRRYKAIFDKLYAGDRAITIRRGVWALVLGTLGQVAFYGDVPVDRARDDRQTQITLGAMTMYVLVFKQAQSALSSALGDVGGMYEDNLYLSNLYEFLDTPTITRERRPRPNGTEPGDGVRFEARVVHVPGRERAARSTTIDAAHPAGQQARDRRRERLAARRR